MQIARKINNYFVSETVNSKLFYGILKPQFLKDKIRDLGGEEYTQGVKGKTGKSKSDLYWDKSGNVYTVPKNGGPPQWVDWLPR